MKVLEKINFRNIENVPQLIKDFLNRDIEGFESHIFSLENFEKQIGNRQKSFSQDQREILSQELRKQLLELRLSDNQSENISLLEKSNTFTVTTGHQLNLFSGPVFFIYKILQTIKTCVFLKQNFTEFNFVPIFWMATEDHDFDEINHFKTRNNFYEIKGKRGGAAGKIKLTDTYFISEFEKEFKDHIFGTELIMMLKESYQSGKTLTESIRILVNRLFAEYGLLIIDGDSEALKRQMAGIFEDEILNSALYRESKQRVETLTSKYGKVQVNPRKINLFYLSETRNRIDVSQDKFLINDTEHYFSAKELIADLKNYPQKFSPNALMRPVYQEKILPNLAYIGGNAEIMYWLELKDYFKSLQIPFPVLIPRNSMLFIEDKILKKIEKLNLSIKDFFGNFAQITNRKILNDHEILHKINENENILKQNFQDLKILAEKTEKSFGNMVKGEEIRQVKSFDRLKKRLLKAEKIKQRELLGRLENLFREIHPSKNWQERVFNFSVFFADHGRDWLSYCYDAMEVTQSEIIIVVN